MATGKRRKVAILTRRVTKGSRKKRTRPEPRQYTIADLERARDRVAAAERRIDNERSRSPERGTRGLETRAIRIVRYRVRNYVCAAYLSDESDPEAKCLPIAVT